MNLEERISYREALMFSVGSFMSGTPEMGKFIKNGSTFGRHQR